MTTPDPDGAMRITLKDVYTAQQDSTTQLTAALHGVETAITKLTGHLESIDNRNRTADLAHADFESRLRVLERWRYSLPAAVVAAVASAVVSLWSAVHH